MTAATTTRSAVGTGRTPASRLRRVLLADGEVTALVGLAALLAAEPLADQVGTPTVLRVVGAVLLVAGLDVALLSRVPARRLPLAGTVVGELALLCAAAGVAVVALGAAEPVGAALVLAVAAVCVGFGVAELRLAAALRRG